MRGSLSLPSTTGGGASASFEQHVGEPEPSSHGEEIGAGRRRLNDMPGNGQRHPTTGHRSGWRPGVSTLRRQYRGTLVGAVPKVHDRVI